MDWTRFNSHGESPNHAFEILCNILFLKWCEKEYGKQIVYCTTVNGAGGDGGVEAYAVLDNGDIIAVQSKWFRETIGNTQISEIKKSIETALRIRPSINRYIVCVPRDLSSQRNGKNGNPITNTEETRWNSLVSKISETYPCLKLELWNETRITQELQNKESTGCKLYFFDNIEITEDVISASYDKAVTGWAKTKYIPDLFVPGFIHDHMTRFLGSEETNNKVVNVTKKVINDLEELMLAINSTLLWINDHEPNNSIKQYLLNDKKATNSKIQYFNTALPTIKYGVAIDLNSKMVRTDFECSERIIRDSRLEHKSYFHIHNLREAMHKVSEDLFAVSRLLEHTDENRVVFTGNPGTGKTVGIVAEIKHLLDEKIHIPILIHAKDYSKGNTWMDIIIKTLGLNSFWTEDGLFQALEAAAITNESRHIMKYPDKETRVISKVVLCVDGLDESKPYDYWEDRINEAAAFKNRFKRIKFVFLTRPYVLRCERRIDLYKLIKRVPYNGDTNLDKLFDIYLEKYNINIQDNYWIRGMIKTPFTVNLFCDIFAGQKIEHISSDSLVVTKLISKKIENLDSEFSIENREYYNSHDIYKTLVKLSELFVEKKRLLFDDVYYVMIDLSRHRLISILIFLEKQGFLYSFTERSDDILVPPVTYYTCGIQPIWDYLISCQIFRKLKSKIVLDDAFDQGILQMLSLMLLEKEDAFLSQYKDLLPIIDDESLFESICYALANTSLEIAGRHTQYIKDLIHTSPEKFRAITNRIILPVTRISQHPLGSNLFDEFLNEFKSPADRDIWISVPSGLNSGFQEDWYCTEDILIDQFPIKQDSGSTDYPLIACWMLGSVNNSVRLSLRSQLTGWGISNSEAFLSLFSKVITINDPQIREDIMSIAYGISLSQFIDNQYIKKMALWICDNVFSEEGLQKYYDTDIRYYSRGIADIAIGRQLLTEDKARVCVPPYNKTMHILPIATEASSANRMGGYGPIDYDLARYVLCDSIHSMFFSYDHENDKNTTIEASELLKAEKEFFCLDNLSIDGLVISAAYQYILDQGWSNAKFKGTQLHRGIDYAIESTYRSATHGEQSKIMTVAEKYVWCAKAYLTAFFADMLPFYNHEDGFYWLDDYSEIKSYSNPYQDWINSNSDMHREIPPWLHTDLLVKPVIDDYTEVGIYEWMASIALPDFKKWIFDYNSETLLYTFTNIENNKNGISETVIISSGLVKETDVVTLAEFINANNNWQKIDMLNVDDFQSHQKGTGYCTPQEACVVRSRKELYDAISLTCGNNSITVYKALSRCLIGYGIDGEKEFKIPGKLLRSLMGITYGDGYMYSNNSGDVICRYSERKDVTFDYQTCLLADQSVLKDCLLKTGYKMFWLFRIIRRPSHMAIERFPNIHKDADHTFLVWFDENGQYEYKYLHPLHSKDDWNLPLNLLE